jgi:hypothetical protein
MSALDAARRLSDNPQTDARVLGGVATLAVAEQLHVANLLTAIRNGTITGDRAREATRVVLDGLGLSR